MYSGVLYMALNDTITPADLSTVPADTVNWAVVRSVNQLYAHNRGDICKFYGMVYTSEISMVITGQYKSKVIFSHYQADIGNSNIKFDELQIETNDQSGLDTDIPTSKDHDIIDTYLEGNYPFDEDGERITGAWAILTLRKNHTVNLITSDNQRSQIVELTNYSERAY